MTHFRIRTTILGLTAVSLAACASTPQYPSREGVAAGSGPQMAAPAYAITKPTKPAKPVVPKVDDEGYAVPPAQPTTPVDKGSLDPVTSEDLPPPQPRPQRVAYVDPREAASIRIFGNPEEVTEPGFIQIVDRKPVAKKKAAAPAADKKGADKKGKKAAPEPKPSSSKATPGVIAGGAVVDAAGPPVVYTVKSGDTIDALARKFSTTRKALADANDLESPYKLKPGQKIKGPQSRAKAYVVQSGDTLYAIARRFTVEASALADANDMKVSAALRPGKKLLLPSGYKDKGVAKPPAAAKPTAPKPTPPRTSAPLGPPQPAYDPPAPAYRPPEPVYRPPAPEPARPPIPLTREPVDVPSPGLEVSGNPAPRRPTPGTTSDLPSRPQPYDPSSAPPRRASPPAPVPADPGRMVDSAPPVSDAEITSLGRGRFDWPVRGEVLSDYGMKGGGQRNDGVNIRAQAGSPVRAAAAGEVVYAGDQVPGFGNTVLIKHPDGWVTVYAHLARTDVKMRQQVQAGAQIGQVGSSGGVGEPQLHFEVRYSSSNREKARAVNPALVLPR